MSLKIVSLFVTTMCLSTSPAKCLAAFDKNQDGKLDLVEFKNLCMELFQIENSADICCNHIEEIFAIFDRNNDGFIDQEEFQRCHKDWIQTILNPISALLVIDMQNDFITGSLRVPPDCDKEPADLVTPINELVSVADFKGVFCSLDWHSEDHISFYDNVFLRPIDASSPIKAEDAQLFSTVVFAGKIPKPQTLWPKHCVQGTFGAELHSDIKLPNATIIYKGVNPEIDSYSAFWDNAKVGQTDLNEKLRALNVTDVYVTGLALDYCVGSTILDSLDFGYRTVLVEDCTMSISQDGKEKMMEKIAANHGLSVTAKAVPDMVSGKERNILLAYQHALYLKKKYISCKCKHK